MQQQQAVLVATSTEANVTAWDVATATQLGVFKTNACGRGRLTRLGPDYFAAAQSSKDAVHFWTWHRDQVMQRCFTQEPLTSLAGSPDGAYLAAGGASGALYVWEAASGRLLRSWAAHYKAVSCLVFSDSGGVLVSGGEDGLVAAWLLAEVLDEQRDATSAAAAALAAAGQRVQALHTWSEHTLAVTSLHLGAGDACALLVTASLDRTVKLWSLSTGALLRSMTLPAGVTAVALDAGEHVLLAGGTDGSIWEVSLTGGQPRQQLLQAQQAAAGSSAAASAAAAAAAAAPGLIGGPGSCCYEGHTKAISSLAVTPDGEQLVSGCEDGSVRVWDLRSRQCLRVISSPNRAPVSAALLLAWPSHLVGLAQQGGSGRQGPKRLQPLAPLAKFAAAASSAKPWEGPPVILDGSLLQHQRGSSSSSSAAVPGGLLPAALGPVEALQQAAAAIGSGGAPEQWQGASAAAAAAGGRIGEGGESVAELQATVARLQQQLAESQQVAQQWQELHAQLHTFCTDSVLAGVAGGAS